MRELGRISSRLGISVAPSRLRSYSTGQSVFFGSQFHLLSDEWIASPHAVATAYFHGRPGTGPEEFDVLYDRLRRHHERLARVQVSHEEAHRMILETGISPEKVFRIPIGVNLSFFPLQTPSAKRRARRRYRIPQSAVVVGSFQKDGSGWGEGNDPKLIKGPDIFLETLAVLRERIPELHVLLSGPSRGYVRRGLGELSIPFSHVYVKRYPDIGNLYQALDLYLVSSRQEGGPKAVLESMASGVPLVTTRVGQAADIVRHGENGFMVDVEDVEGLAHWSEHLLQRPGDMAEVLGEARKTAVSHSYESQVPLWREFMDGFVERGSRPSGS